MSEESLCNKAVPGLNADKDILDGDYFINKDKCKE